MQSRIRLTTGLTAGILTAATLSADDRRFTYVYEPETMPAGAAEIENWITLRSGRTGGGTVDKEKYTRWDLRQEIEYGVTDRYQIAIYLNEKAESYHAPSVGEDVSSFDFKGISIENMYNVLNPAEHAVGFTPYLEGTYAGDEAELEVKLIFGQRYDAWKWALNLENATEWEDNLTQVEGEFGVSLGLARDLGHNWSVGVELRSKSLMPDYEEFESTALYLGPVVSYRREGWWTALTVLPQIHGWNHQGNPDDNTSLELTSNERLQIRWLLGINL